MVSVVERLLYLWFHDSHQVDLITGLRMTIGLGWSDHGDLTLYHRTLEFTEASSE